MREIRRGLNGSSQFRLPTRSLERNIDPLAGTMRAFEVYLNRKRLCVAGIGDDGVLDTMVDHVVGKGRTEGICELAVSSVRPGNTSCGGTKNSRRGMKFE
jgi:hypothetical protein